MDRNEKQAQVKELSDAFKTVAGAVLTGVAGLTVAESTTVRRKFHAAGVKFKVVKNTLARIAADTTDLKAISALFVGPTAIAWHPTDPVAPAKAVMELKKEMEKLELKGGYSGGQKLSLEEVKALAELPSIEEIRSRLLGTINGPAATLLAQINAPAQNIVGVVKAWSEKQEKAA